MRTTLLYFFKAFLSVAIENTFWLFANYFFNKNILLTIVPVTTSHPLPLIKISHSLIKNKNTNY